MKKNVGTTDRMIRILLALVIAVLYLTNIISGIVGIILLVIAFILILTSLFSFCPLYTLFGASTNKKK